MTAAERVALAVLHRLDPELSHDLALRALRSGLAPSPGQVTSNRLRTRVFGRDFPNPVGTAAGFDKNAIAVRQTLKTGFGFAEVGAVTPRPQPGNPKPRLFRLPADQAIINRFGFNNHGLEAMQARLVALGQPVGINLGANKDSEDRAADYVAGVAALSPYALFFTVNVSSPNTANLRNLQVGDALSDLLGRVMDARAQTAERPPVLIKIAPDLSDAELAKIAEISVAHRLDGIVATNTTIQRDGLTCRNAGEAGGLSGAPLRARSLQVLRLLYRETAGEMPLIGVGGIASAEDAYARIRAGASLVQLYTALIYRGISLGAEIARGLDDLLRRDGVARVADAVGTDQPIKA